MTLTITWNICLFYSWSYQALVFIMKPVTLLNKFSFYLIKIILIKRKINKQCFEQFWLHSMQKNKRNNCDHFLLIFLYKLASYKYVFKNLLLRVAGDWHDATHVRREGQSHLVRRAAHRSWIRRRRKKQRMYFYQVLCPFLSNNHIST